MIFFKCFAHICMLPWLWSKTLKDTPANISEGAGRDSTKEYVRFLNISIGSLSELETQMIKIKEQRELIDNQREEIMKSILDDE